MARRERREVVKSKMDMTPMIDVVFQLIIFFILTMTVTSPDLRPVQLPTALTAVTENPREQITMLHMYNDYSPANAPTDIDLAVPPKDVWWHVTLSRDARRFISKFAEGASRGGVAADILVDLPKELEARAQQWKPGPEDREQEPTKDVGSGPVFNMPILIRGDMRAPIIYFASIVKACETAKIWRVEVSIAPPPEIISGGGN
ncbi:MAG: biopolymer transporter ExbD [Planctomycetes bacterium]|nr:biopolymer transporter ExbD [Planctomycetota bacterium]